jgi:hypothetical protein
VRGGTLWATGWCLCGGDKRGRLVLRALRIEDIAGATGVHAVREDAGARVDSIDEPGGAAAGGAGQRRDGLAAAAETCRDASDGAIFSRMAVGGPRDERLRVDAAGGGAAGVGISRVAEDPQGQAGDEGAELGEPEDFDVCAGGGVRPDPAVVDPGGAAFGKDDGGDCAVPGIAVRNFVGRDFDCGDGIVLQGGDAEFVVGEREDVVVGEFGGVGDVCGDDVGGVGVDVGAEKNYHRGHGGKRTEAAEKSGGGGPPSPQNTRLRQALRALQGGRDASMLLV